MAEGTNKVETYISQTLPFLESAPLWLRYWVYILLILVLVTLALVLYYNLEARLAESRSKDFQHSFEIVKPNQNSEIRLPPNGAWMIEGRLPIRGEAQPDEERAEIKIEVFRLPERTPVPQSGALHLSNVSGKWRYQAQFPGIGRYEVYAEATIGAHVDFKTIEVDCVVMEEALLAAIEFDRESRGVPAALAARVGSAELQSQKMDLFEKQNSFFSVFPADLDAALGNIDETLDILDPLLLAYPGDVYLQDIRAFTFKNYAMVMRELNKPEEFDRALDEAERMFEAVRVQTPEDPGAWNGLGSVAILRGDPGTALHFINQALELQPNYPAAISDKAIAERMLAQEDA